jgi:hypothetical protein
MAKEHIPALGTKADDQRREHIRMDTDTRRELVEAARRLMFIHGNSITSKAVEDRLGPQSLTPTRVCIYIY